ncbi:hypothetical protein M8C21_027408 [Ambrosia artemisiifolia]|uniref:Uncharacterized protein n=1 Tax=Ambrosia artemisiifolia TaxID=4212 RepID=A0AAD5BXS9_AMBAR|nr:hypothetical protein M8C21_027408 [Ambrosia artemisiifolia]
MIWFYMIFFLCFLCGLMQGSSAQFKDTPNAPIMFN